VLVWCEMIERLRNNFLMASVAPPPVTPPPMPQVDLLLKTIPQLGTNLTAAERAATVANECYWKALCPRLHVGSADMRRALADTMIDPEADLVDELRDRMSQDGYWDVSHDALREDGTVHLSWAVNVAAMAEAMTLLTKAGWPPSFLLMYDEPWLLAHQLKYVIRMTSGNQMLYDFAFFNVGSNLTPTGEVDEAGGASSRGWAPHRDRGEDATKAAFRNDGTPQYCTTWVALTDATTYSSCLACVPKRHDPGYSGGYTGTVFARASARGASASASPRLWRRISTRLRLYSEGP
jgi:hypothetical protein